MTYYNVLNVPYREKNPTPSTIEKKKMPLNQIFYLLLFSSPVLKIENNF